MPVSPPSYGDRTFWDSRFRTEAHFEWLGVGGSLIALIEEHLETVAASDSTPIPKTLHIGAGTSVLHEPILHIYQRLYPDVDGIIIVNSDYSAEAVAKGKESMQPDASGPKCAWEICNALDWADTLALARKYGMTGYDSPMFEIVVDKSTSDAISCHENIDIGHADEPDAMPNYHPLLVQLHSSIDPLQLLALHLAAIVRPGGIWLALSYSSNRFPFLENGGTGEKEEDVVGAGRWWKVDAVVPVEAANAASKHGIHAPTIMHHLYKLRRTTELV